MKFSSFKAFATILLGAAVYATADPQLVMQSISAENIANRISQLQSMKNDNSLSEEERGQLDLLWKQAAAIQALNDKCSTIDLTDVIDKDCQNLYQVDFPAFETQFFKVTGEIRLNPNRLSQAMNNKRLAIEQCYDALQVEAFYPSRYFELDGTYTPEPLSNGFEVSYDFSLQDKSSALQDLANHLQDWYGICQQIIQRSDGSGNLAPLFVEKVNQSIDNAGKTMGSLYFDINESMGRTSIQVKTKKGIHGTYLLNEIQLFEYNIPAGEELFIIELNDEQIALRNRSGDSWNGTKTYTNVDESKGLTGTFRWSDGESKGFAGFFGRSSKGSVQSSTGSGTSESGPGFFVQFMGSFNIPGHGSISDKLKEEYSDVWEINEDWADSSLSLYNPYITVQVGFELNRHIAFSVGGGIAWMIASVSEDEVYHPETITSSYYTETLDEVSLRTAVAPVVQAEISVGEPNICTGGIRETFIIDSMWPTNYLGAFVELANLLGIEVGWVHNTDFWDDKVYLGFYVKLPPRHLTDFFKKK